VPAHSKTASVDPKDKDDLLLAILGIEQDVSYEISSENESGYFEIDFGDGSSIEVRNDTFPFWVYRNGKRVSMYKSAEHAISSFGFDK
jgi:hypothetical protein